mmetsp:Transcript_14025/g.36230  ORF Transcript_14025/g.36230 Transcript_14025/m.36230 type:complete len:254 (+) Transcript_14025:261-1022(+)
MMCSFGVSRGHRGASSRSMPTSANQCASIWASCNRSSPSFRQSRHGAPSRPHKCAAARGLSTAFQGRRPGGRRPQVWMRARPTLSELPQIPTRPPTATCVIRCRCASRRRRIEVHRCRTRRVAPLYRYGDLLNGCDANPRDGGAMPHRFQHAKSSGMLQHVKRRAGYASIQQVKNLYAHVQHVDVQHCEHSAWSLFTATCACMPHCALSTCGHLAGEPSHITGLCWRTCRCALACKRHPVMENRTTGADRVQA